MKPEGSEYHNAPITIPYEEVSLNDIIDNMGIDDIHRRLTKDLLNDFEKQTAEFIKQNKEVAIPGICRIIKNPLKQFTIDNTNKFRELRKNSENAFEYKINAKKICTEMLKMNKNEIKFKFK